jgi:V/A-type H+-transporting ATPase subunit I
MIFTTEMIQLFAVVPGTDREHVTEALLREGVMQFINVSEIEAENPNGLSAVKPEISLTEISDLRKRAEGFLYTGRIIPSVPRETDLNHRVSVDIEKEKKYLDKIETELESTRERQRIIQQEILKMDDIRRQVELYGIGLSDVKLPGKQSFLTIQTGKLPVLNVKKLESELQDIPSLNIALGEQADMAHYLLISMKRDSERINTILSNIGWIKIELPEELKAVKEDVFKELSEKLRTLTDEQKKLEIKAVDSIKKEEKHLRDIWINLRVRELFFIIQTNFKASSRTVIFSGWLPASKKEKLNRSIKKACKNRCYLEWNEAKSNNISREEIPVQLNNPKILAPFQMLVSNFGIPQYGTVDPTPFVMPVYLTMFGLMFADIGQGLILVLFGILSARYFKKQQEKQGLYNLSWLIIWCGSFAVFFGALFGSVFGTGIIKPLWFNYHGIVSGHYTGDSAINDIYDILSITIYFGITVILLGLVFNWINLVRTRKPMELLFDKGGVMGGWIYVGGIYVAFYVVEHDYREYPSGMIIFALVGLPSLLLLIREPYHYIKHKNENSENGTPRGVSHGGKFNPFIIFNFLMQWLVELLEIFTGYLSNTLSFMRVAGLGIAHVSLMIAFFKLADMASGIFSVIILILGNILVISLEGLSAGVQALRLNYYEFFTKFFHGTGKLYTPISLSSGYK